MSQSRLMELSNIPIPSADCTCKNMSMQHVYHFGGQWTDLRTAVPRPCPFLQPPLVIVTSFRVLWFLSLLRYQFGIRYVCLIFILFLNFLIDDWCMCGVRNRVCDSRFGLHEPTSFFFSCISGVHACYYNDVGLKQIVHKFKRLCVDRNCSGCDSEVWLTRSDKFFFLGFRGFTLITSTV